MSGWKCRIWLDGGMDRKLGECMDVWVVGKMDMKTGWAVRGIFR